MNHSWLAARLESQARNRPGSRVTRGRAKTDSPRRGNTLGLRVVAYGPGRITGSLVVGTRVIPCILGRSGTRRLKREGDGATPSGVWRLEAVLYRPDRGRPRTALPAFAISRFDGWCDDPASHRYNRPVRLPFEASHEKLWRDDRLYDRIVLLSHNRHPVRRGHGSAVFLHIARAERTPTEGCVAVDDKLIDQLLGRIEMVSGNRIVVGT